MMTSEDVKVDFKPEKYTLDQLREIARRISSETFKREKDQENIDLIDLKTKYEHQWVCFIEDTPTEIFYIKEIDTTYHANVIRLSLDSNDLFNLFDVKKRYLYSIGDYSFRGTDMFDHAHIMDADEAGMWITDFKQIVLDFIDNIGAE